MLKRCQDEFYMEKQTKISFPFSLDEDELQTRLFEIKLGNVRLISIIIKITI